MAVDRNVVAADIVETIKQGVEYRLAAEWGWPTEYLWLESHIRQNCPLTDGERSMLRRIIQTASEIDKAMSGDSIVSIAGKLYREIPPE